MGAQALLLDCVCAAAPSPYLGVHSERLRAAGILLLAAMDITSERIFCAEQINVPSELPDVLKEYTKAVIRTNPSAGEADPMAARLKLFQWSRDYFRQKTQEAK